ncbi:FAD-dependent oxidoreductase [Nonomuraea dietziae]
MVGAGFAGLAATRQLARAGARVTLIDRNPYTTLPAPALPGGDGGARSR